MYFTINKIIPLSFFILLLLEFAMPKKRRSGIFFGGPENFSGSQLPSYEACGQAWKASQLELQASRPGVKIVNREVAKHVCKMTELEIECITASIYQSIKQSIKQSINHSINQSVNQEKSSFGSMENWPTCGSIGLV